MKAAKIYKFYELEACPMCGAPASQAAVRGMRLNRRQGLTPRRLTGIAVGVCRCRSCGMSFPQPLPIPNSLEDHYGVPPESYWTESYFQVDPNYFSRQIDDAKRLLNFKPGMKALDIGAGIGKAMIALDRAGFDTWGIEPSTPFYQRAIERMGIDRGRLALAPLETATFERDFFDFVTFGAVLEHLEDPAGSIERAMVWLRPGGVMQIEVPSSDYLLEKIINFYFRTRGVNFVSTLSPMHSPYHLYSFMPQSFRSHGARTGYTVAYDYLDNGSIRLFPSFLHGLLRAMMTISKGGMQLTVWLRKTG